MSLQENKMGIKPIIIHWTKKGFLTGAFLCFFVKAFGQQPGYHYVTKKFNPPGEKPIDDYHIMIYKPAHEIWFYERCPNKYQIKIYNYRTQSWRIDSFNLILPKRFTYIYLQYLFPDSKGNIWVSTFWDGIYEITTKNDTIHWPFYSNITRENGSFGGIAEDKQGNIWVAKMGMGSGNGYPKDSDYLLRYNGHSWDTMPAPYIEVPFTDFPLLYTSDGSLWFKFNNKSPIVKVYQLKNGKWIVYNLGNITAINGDSWRILYEDNLHHIWTEGPFLSNYYGNQIVDTKLVHSKYRLIADDGFDNFRTNDDYIEIGNGDWRDISMPADKDDNWGSSHWAATSTQYCVTLAWNFFINRYKRNGFNGQGIETFVGADVPTRAQFGPGTVYDAPANNTYGGTIYISDETNPATGKVELGDTYDIVGHEFAHGIIQWTRQMEYEKETGALEESFADIMGFRIEDYYKGSPNWLLEDDRGFADRDLQNPNNYGQPAWYGQPGYWFNTNGCIPDEYTNDYCGVHVNSGVQNKWYYLLSEGGTQLSVTVTGIGIDKASDIVYYAYTHYVNLNETYKQARAHTIEAAIHLFGTCSFEAQQTVLAWDAVNVPGQGLLCSKVPPCWETGCNAGSSPNNSEMGVKPTMKQNKFNVALYPNPTDNFLMADIQNINKYQLSQMKLTLLDMNGDVVKNVKTNNDQFSIRINLQDLPQGVYILRVTSLNWVQNIKVIKQ